MEPSVGASALSEDDTLSLWVGRVARTHALLEYNVSSVHHFLLRRAGQEVDGTSMKGFDQTVTEAIGLLRRSDLGEDIVASGVVALRSARQATSRRNRVVHDMWLPAPSEDGSAPPRFSTFRRQGSSSEHYTFVGPEDLSTIVGAHALLVRARMRVSGLFMALHSRWPDPDDRGSVRDDNVERYIALMNDRFVLHPNGDFDIT